MFAVGLLVVRPAHHIEETMDLVRVTGSMDKDFLEGRRFEAEAVITLSS